MLGDGAGAHQPGADASATRQATAATKHVEMLEQHVVVKDEAV